MAVYFAARVVVVLALAETVIGTSGKDVLRGTPRADKPYGKVGNDRLFGPGGDDVLIGGLRASRFPNACTLRKSGMDFVSQM